MDKEWFGITAGDMAGRFGYGSGRLPEFIEEKLNRMDTRYRLPDPDEYGEYVLEFLNLLDLKRLRRTRDENLAAFEEGWHRNYLELIRPDTDDLRALKPGYFRDHKFFRYDNRLIVPKNRQLEFDLFTIARYVLFDRYLKAFPAVCELGCGSCHNLLMLAEMFKKTEIIGLDWTENSVRIAEYLSRERDKNIRGYRFDLLGRQPIPDLPEKCAVVSIHAFEQLGENFRGILEKILACRPEIVVQYEPVSEFYAGDNLLDVLALKYYKKRAYLTGYYTALKQMAAEGKIEIIAAYRPFLGGVFHESSVLVWRPV